VSRETRPDVIEFRLPPIPEQLRPATVMALSAVLMNGPGLYILAVSRQAKSIAVSSFVVALAVAGFLAADLFGVMALRLGARRVEVRPDTLVAYNGDGVINVRREDISDVGLRSRTFGRSMALAWTPLVTLRGGRVFFLDALATGSTKAPPTSRQLAPLDQLRATLGLTATMTQSARPVSGPTDGPQLPPIRAIPLRHRTVVRVAFIAKIVTLAALSIAVITIGATTPGRRYTASVAAGVYLAGALVVIRNVLNSPEGHSLDTVTRE
jgi:hypothetical protein